MNSKTMVWTLLQSAKLNPDYLSTTNEAISLAREFINAPEESTSSGLIETLKSYRERFNILEEDIFIGVYSDGTCALYSVEDSEALQVFDNTQEAIEWLNSEKPIKEYWIFLQYYNEEDAPLGAFKIDVFDDFEKMKTFSGEQSSHFKKRWPNYCSTYTKVENL